MFIAPGRRSLLLIPYGWEPRDHTSPSALDADESCNAAWGLRYLEGLREPEVSWEQIEAGAECSSGMRSKSLGTAGHGVLERYFGGLATPEDWETTPGRIMRAGLHLLPHPEECVETLIESDLKIVSPHALRVKGKLDLLARVSTAGLERLGINAKRRYDDGSAWVLFDYKTTSDFRWAKTADQLRRNTQGILYPLGTMQILNAAEIPCRWVYFRTKGAPAAKAVDWTAEYIEVWTRAQPLLARGAELAALIRARASWKDLKKNPAACGKYSGCEYHVSAGGPCDPGPSGLRAWIGSRPEPKHGGTIEMAETFAQRKARMAAEAGGQAAPAQQPATAPAPVAAAATPKPAKAAAQPTPAPQPAAVAPENPPDTDGFGRLSIQWDENSHSHGMVYVPAEARAEVVELLKALLCG